MRKWGRDERDSKALLKKVKIGKTEKMAPETRNLIAAMSLSLAILIGWQLYVVEPEMQADRAAYEAQQAQTQTQATGGQRPQANVAAGQDTNAPVAQDTGVRIQIDAPQLSGSFSTMGGRIDDVILKGYFETQQDDAGLIHLFKRFDSDTPYFAEFGWVASGNAITLPDEQTVWQADRQTLTGGPVTLTYDNGDGLVFTRRFAINEDYLITVTDSVASSRTEPATLSPYSLLRLNTPDTLGLYILHEGPLGGVFDETLSEKIMMICVMQAAKNMTFSPDQAGGGWIGITDKYWLAALMPVQSENAFLLYAVLFLQRPRLESRWISIRRDMLGEALRLDPGQQINWQTYLFSGAKKVTSLDRYAEELKIANFDLAIDFGWFTS